MLTVRGKRPLGPLVLLLIALGLPGWANASKLLYRYFDDKGVPNIDHRVPPEFAKNGYTVMRPDGTVAEVVPRQLTPEEMKGQGSAEAQRRAAEAEAKRLQEWDESLLRRYSTTVDIEAARAKGLTSTYREVEYGFCGRGCKLEFDEDPERYLSPDHVPTM